MGERSVVSRSRRRTSPVAKHGTRTKPDPIVTIFSMRRSSALLAKPRVVVLGSGWAGFAVAKHLKPRLFDVTIVSPRNHMLFTVSRVSLAGTLA